MQIHVISTGQSLYGIANAYNTSVDAIAEANQINPANSLVVGQVLVIPITGMYYWVRPGDSLYSISRKFNVNMMELARINNIQINQTLPVGLRLYIPPSSRKDIEVNAYVEPIGGEVSQSLENSVSENAMHLTYLAPFSFEIQRDGSLKEPPLNNFSTIASEHGVTLMMVVTNLEDGQFSASLGEVILNNQELQNTLLNNIIETARRLGFKDIHFDMEHLRQEDREAYNNFLRKASERIHGEGYLMSTALAPKTSAEQTGDWYTAHDYRVHGEVADFVVIMTYEWGYSGGPPMPVSPIGPVRRVLEYALTEIPANKILMGQNLYGYDWTLPYVPGERYARAISPQEAINLARNNNVQISYDYVAQAPHFRYVDAEGNIHEVWFEDGRSIQAKFNLIKELNIRGISYWKLGIPFPQNWLLLQDNFTVIKR